MDEKLHRLTVLSLDIVACVFMWCHFQDTDIFALKLLGYLECLLRHWCSSFLCVKGGELYHHDLHSWSTQALRNLCIAVKILIILKYVNVFPKNKQLCALVIMIIQEEINCRGQLPWQKPLWPRKICRHQFTLQVKEKSMYFSICTLFF